MTLSDAVSYATLASIVIAMFGVWWAVADTAAK